MLTPSRILNTDSAEFSPLAGPLFGISSASPLPDDESSLFDVDGVDSVGFLVGRVVVGGGIGSIVGGGVGSRVPSPTQFRTTSHAMVQ